MSMVKRGFVARQRRKKILFLTKSVIGSNFCLFQIAQQHIIKSFLYSYHNRRKKKQYYRLIWIVRLTAIARVYDWNYGYLIYSIRKNKCLLNRKSIVQLLLFNPVRWEFLFNQELRYLSAIYKEYFSKSIQFSKNNN